MKILAIETSCDETAVSVLEATESHADIRYHLLGDALYSQAKKHATFGGVYPSLAKREHAENLLPLLAVALEKAHLAVETPATHREEMVGRIHTILAREERLAHLLCTKLATLAPPSVDAIAVTTGPGLEPALWVGVSFAKALAYAWHIPLIPVNHLEGHLVASAVRKDPDTPDTYTLPALTFPMTGLVLSGGHTEFIHMQKWGTYTVVGATRDDSVGEAFDKVARLLGIPYPGGAELSRLAERGRPYLHTHDVSYPRHPYPRPMLASGDLDFSFSGLKTALKYHIQSLEANLDEGMRMRIAAEFEEAVAEVVVTKTVHALGAYPSHAFLLGGGVSANTYLQKRLTEALASEGTPLLLPAPGLSTDNAVMIGMAGYLAHMRGDTKHAEEIDAVCADGNLSLSPTP